MTTFKQWLEYNGACDEAIDWVKDQTAEQAWQNCERGDWMVYALAKARYPKTELVRLCVEIARTVQYLVSDPRVSKCLDVTEAWCDGKASLEKVGKARKEANISTLKKTYRAINTVAYASAAYAAIATADTADTVNDASHVVRHVAYAAYSTYRVALEVPLKRYADLIRTRVPVEMVVGLVNGCF
jgi:hypothetical protein